MIGKASAVWQFILTPLPVAPPQGGGNRRRAPCEAPATEWGRGTCALRARAVTQMTKARATAFPPPCGEGQGGGVTSAEEGHAGATRHSFSLAFATTSDHRLASSASSRPNGSPGVAVVSKPSATSLSFTSGSPAIASAAAWKRPATGLGVLAGMKKPVHTLMTNPG